MATLSVFLFFPSLGFLRPRVSLINIFLFSQRLLGSSDVALDVSPASSSCRGEGKTLFLLEPTAEL